MHTGEYATAQKYAYPGAVSPQIFLHPVLNDFPDYCFLDNRRNDSSLCAPGVREAVKSRGLALVTCSEAQR